jgi:hypothetical protein
LHRRFNNLSTGCKHPHRLSRALQPRFANLT